MYLLSLISVILPLAIYLIISSRRKKARNEVEAAVRGCLPPPTLRSTNLFGTSVVQASIAANKADRGPQHVVKTMNSLGKNVHTMRVPVLNHEIIITRDLENVKTLFTSADFDVSISRARSFMPLLGEGLFTSRGSQWKHSRALVRPQFQKDEVSNLDLVDRHVQTLLRILKPKSGSSWTGDVDLQPLFFNFSLDTITEFLYGQSVNSQSALTDLEKSKDSIDGAAFAYHLDEAKHVVDKRSALGRLYWLMPMKKMREHCTQVHKVIDSLVQGRLSSNPHSAEEKGRKFVLLDELMKETRNPIELRNETIHTMVAGRDTKAAWCGWIFYLLARHPAVFAKLRNIVLEQFGTDPTSMDSMTVTNIRKCEYLQNVLQEVIRVIAIVPMNERVAVRDTTLPSGGGEDGEAPMFVPEGVQVLMPTYAIQRREDIWGSDVDAFRPERWEGRKANGWEWVAFGGGARKCLGRDLAMVETSHTIIRFLQTFDNIENTDPISTAENWVKEIRLHTAIENRSPTGIHISFHLA